MSFNLSEIFEQAADAVPEREAFVQGARRLTFAQLDSRATRLANHLRAQGVGSGQHVGLLLMNCSEYLEAMFAAYKLRAVPININYRYVQGELRYLFDDADLVALIVHQRFVPQVAAIREDLPRLAHVVEVPDDSGEDGTLAGAIPYEQALAQASSERAFAGRSDDDLYIIYTGGTTGMPKGVMWRHADIYMSAMGGGSTIAGDAPVSTPDELRERVSKTPLTVLVAPPLMHAAAQWGAIAMLVLGNRLVFPAGGGFEPAAIWELVGLEKVNFMPIVGDAMGRPLADELAANRDRYDVDTLLAIASGGALFSPSTKERLVALLPNCALLDTVGSSETGVMATSMRSVREKEAGDQRFAINDQTRVLDESGLPVVPGSGQVGLLARRAHVPIGYYKDDAKSRTTFIEIDGERWALPGDMATVEADGTITLLGRGSVSINTGGEKVFPEEVELVLKAHPDVFDVVVVGVPDAHWGERVIAVVQLREGAGLGLPALSEFCASRIARYKTPRDLVIVDRIVRSPAGKADYPRAREQAIAALRDVTS